MSTSTDSTLQFAPGRRRRGPDERPRSRRWLFGFYAVVLLCFVIAAPGLVTFETKLGVVLDPWKFLGDLGQLWSDESGFGGLTNQYIGYLFPMLPFYALTDLIGLPVWLAERLWLALVVTTAFWGALRLAERLRIGSPATRLVGATAYALWPTFTIIVGSTSAGALPGAVLPWVLLPLMSERLSARVAAATSALIIPFMGGVNAASTLCALLPVGLYLVTRTGRRRTSLLLWWLPGALLATLWWTIPLLLMGSYVENFMAYVEQAWNTTSTMSAVEMLRGTGNWVGYLNFGSAWLPAGWLLATGVLAIIGTTLAAALGLAGLARRDMPERRWLMLTAIVVTAVMLAGYAGSLGAPFAEGVQSLLDGALKPFRNIYKFQPGLALALALGLAHLVAVFARSDGARPLPGRRFLPALAAALVLPAMALPYLNGDVLQPGGFKELPKHWQQTADWLEDNSPENRALVVPSTAHGIYTWGSPIDQPLHVLAESPWAQRDYVPFGTPGERRMMDAVEQALMSGGEVPGLSDYLGRAGLHNVVVRNDLDPDQVGYVPPQTVKRTLEASGYKKVKDFGPTVTAGRIPADTPIEIQGFYPRQKSVEIYEPAEAKRPSRVAAQPVSETARLSGGPESMLPLSADPNFRDRPVVLTGDNHPGIGNPSLQVNGDGLRRADTRFGLINNNTSYTYTKDEKNHEGSLQDAGKEPKQILPSPQLKHQTVAELRGAKNVTASSSGSWLFHMPQFDPVNAFDGNPESGWAEASAGDSTGEWIKIDFDGATDIPGSIDLTPLAGDGVRPSVTGVKIETDRGSEESTLQPNDETQRVKAPRGTAKWLKLTITDVQESRAGITGAGFAEIEIPDVQVTRMLALPNDAPGDRTESEIYSMHRSPDPGGLNPAGIESGLHRQFTSERSAEYTLKASATPVPGSAYDDMLDEIAPGSRDRITASAESVSPTGVSLSARNLVDGDLTTAWIAGDKPVIRLSWPEKTEVDSMVLSAAGGVSAKPAEVEITSDDGAVTTSVDENGWARFEAMETDSMQITITKTAPTTLHNPVAGDDIQLPVGLNELHVPALEDFRVEAPAGNRKFELECGDGPMIAIDGTLHATKASGKVSDLTERRPISVELCAGDQKNGTIELDSGKHTLETGSGGPLAINDLTLTRGDTAPKASAEREVTVKDWAGEDREVEVGSGEASYLRTHMNINKGWKATLDGKELTSLRLDGWQQGYLIPAGEGGTVKLEYTPTTYYQGGLAVAGVGIVGLLGMAFIRRRGGEPLGAQDAAPAPSWVLGGVVLTLVFALIAGPYALIVPALAVVAWLRPRWLVPLSAAAMLGAGVIVALGAGDGYVADAGAFGWPAQALALLALAAALVTVPQRERAEEPQDERPSYTEPAPASAGGMPAPPLPHRHPEQQGQQQTQQLQQTQQDGPAQQGRHGGPSAPPGEEPSR
ncbi:alpha-(1-_3)-arabinofuranosyltransferase family protein [Streptomyces sp. XM4193]|uniref:alpha-(1->3)-arabinofuranosyltransferase domain-containing protein n=1 Tax=Streptomyces sp. XM4193 TaxID=2929782 RepID=UPI001FF99E73|nr:alpha-(1->3)-arabinofuranosyltransferase family protein [Streptomyces sp. XM4193]MCK1795796.1 alpha-(1->3)-arabinofuranosyltransferase family protein [Streptomyces sp. XM4193]